MTDFRFDDVVDSNVMIGPPGKYVQSVCKSCSKQHKVTRKDFERENSLGSKYIPSSVKLAHLEYVSKMRAWNCCYEGQEPLDGFPEKVDSIMIDY